MDWKTTKIHAKTLIYFLISHRYLPNVMLLRRLTTYAIFEQHDFDICMLISRTLQRFHTSNKETYSDRRSLHSLITKYFSL